MVKCDICGSSKAFLDRKLCVPGVKDVHVFTICGVCADLVLLKVKVLKIELSLCSDVSMMRFLNAQ